MRKRPLRLLLMTDLACLVGAVLWTVCALSTRRWGDLVASCMMLICGGGLTLAVLGGRANTTIRR